MGAFGDVAGLQNGAGECRRRRRRRISKRMTMSVVMTWKKKKRTRTMMAYFVANVNENVGVGVERKAIHAEARHTLLLINHDAAACEKGEVGVDVGADVGVDVEVSVDKAAYVRLAWAHACAVGSCWHPRPSWLQWRVEHFHSRATSSW